MYNFLFDVDVALAPGRDTMDPEFKAWFMNWSQGRSVYLVTGLDYDKTVAVLGQDLCQAVTGVWNCAGNQYRSGGQLIRSQSWSPTDPQRAYLERLLARSPWPHKTGDHIEDRGSLTNFTVVGHRATAEQRLAYWQWDSGYGERIKMAMWIRTEFKDLEATLDGQTGIDIYPKGWNKSQVMDHIPGPAVFFGDVERSGNNEWILAQRAWRTHTVKDWTATWRTLQDRYTDDQST